jgi:serine protease
LGVAAQVAPASPWDGHPYRHGWVPPRGDSGALASPGASAPVPLSSPVTRKPSGSSGHHSHTAGGFLSSNDLSFGGGVGGVGVTTGAPKVYVVFWGSQWGASSINGQGYTALSGDPQGMAPDLQAFFKGLGTEQSSEEWSGVMTQYCEGVPVGYQTCPSSAPHVGAPPSSGTLAGVWVDSGSPAPGMASGHDLAVEAINAATHFGNTMAASNRNVQYFIVSPTGTNPDGYFNNYCAWHDYTGDSFLSGGAASSPFGSVAFTNMPYVTDMGQSCGQNFVNAGAAGTLDGVTIVGGHEYAETITDQFPAGGWTDSFGSENGDKCAWITSGTGAARNLILATGSFAVQTTWANDYNGGQGGCEISHPIVVTGSPPPPPNTVTVTNPGKQTSRINHAVTLQVQAHDSSASATLSYSASGLPRGLSIKTSTGVIAGTPTRTGTYSAKVTATDNTGAHGSTSFTWVVTR